MRRRSGFSLVEVLVSMALILFIMSILAGAFGAASQAVSDLKAAGDLAEKLRGATDVLKRDLEADHFSDHVNGKNQLLSQLDLGAWLAPGNTPFGFFRIFQGQADAPLNNEGSDLDNIPSFHQTNTSLHYTIALNGTRRSDFLSASVPAGSPLLNAGDPLLGPPDERYQDTINEYNSQLAEVAIFLGPTIDQTDGTDGPAQTLFALYRRQFLVVPTNWSAPAPVQDTAPPQYLEMSTVPNAGEGGGNLTFNTMTDLAAPVRRFGMQRTALQPQGAFYPTANINPTTNTTSYARMSDVNPNFQSADLLMTDVLSFDVRILVKGDSEFRDLFDPQIQLFSNGNPAFSLPNGPRVFDTWSNQMEKLTGVDYTQSLTAGQPTSVPLLQTAGPNPQRILIQALQITLRVWDFKTKKTRQVTIVQQM